MHARRLTETTRGVALVACLVACATMAAACSSAASGSSPPTGAPSPSVTVAPTPGPTPTPTAAASPVIVYPTGATDVVLRVWSGGGLLPMDARLAEMPEINLYGDGRLIRVTDRWRAQDPLLQVLTEVRLTPAAMARLLGAAGEAGLLGPDRHYELEGIFDLWSVSFVLTANGAIHRTSAYALGFGDEESMAPPDEIAARRSLSALLERLRDPRGWLGEQGVSPESSHRAPFVRVYVAPDVTWGGAAGTPGPATARPGQEVRAWPLDVPPTSFGQGAVASEPGWRCAVLAADEVSSAGFDTATHDTRWQSGGRLHQVVLRPLLPDETGCRFW